MSKFLFIKDMLLDNTVLTFNEWIELLYIVSSGIDKTHTLPEKLNGQS